MDTLTDGMGIGTLTIDVWPSYVGIAEGALHLSEPIPSEGGYYTRGQIFWEIIDGELVGRARVHAPAGTWTHLVFCRDHHSPSVVSMTKLAQPLHLPAPDVIDISPISRPLTDQTGILQ